MAFQILSAAARTTTTAGPSGQSLAAKPANAKALLILVNVTAITATPSVTVELRARDASGTGYALWASTAAITAVNVYAYWFRWGTTMASPAVDERVIEVVDRAIPDDWDINMIHADADSITYEVGGQWFAFAD
jgi:hypothetical protein